MPRANKMSIEETKVFYWEDTGAIEYTVRGGHIISAQPVDSAMGTYLWRAGEGDSVEEVHP